LLGTEIDRFISDYLSEIDAGNAAIFAGAGLSVPAGFVDWASLVRPLAEELNLDVSKEADLVAVAQFHVNSNQQNRHALHKAIVDAFAVNTAPTTNHSILARLPITTYWTTNYDKLIEKSLEEAGKIVDVKWALEQLAVTRPRRDATIYKMHGDVDRPDQAIATRDDYEHYGTKNGAFINALAGDLVSKTFLFLGFSFTDPNLEQVLARVRTTFKNHQRRHYAIFRRRKRLDAEDEAEFEYAKIRQALVLEDLKRFNISPLLVDEYDEVTKILAEIERRYRSRTVFISSSASDFAPWGEEAVWSFMRKLGSALMSAKLRLATGMGVGVSNALFSGALETIYNEKLGHLEDRITLRPFPQHIADDAKRKEVWETYRQEIISFSGVALFLFGNKRSGSDIVAADGMIREYEISRKNGLLCLPVGATGHAAEVIAKRFLDEIGSEQPEVTELVRSLLEHRENLNELIEPLLKFITANRAK